MISLCFHNVEFEFMFFDVLHERVLVLGEGRRAMHKCIDDSTE